ncbi:PepSY-associated TM helix domain-containing protein [Marisediminicola senii]|uniref:PepSY-associated TM helix domain-containing protein n=1 Tax=Marisediminicola senii TaxID=2711233 RepID=UPI001F42CA38|nr:PepSY-associated TM helix domain-containing protein [Marisediminicola senii]
MSVTTTPAAASTAPPPQGTPSRGWFGALLLRLHFYAGILIGPFILVAALSGAFYAITPQIERVVYSDELTAPISDQSAPLAEQIAAAQAVVGDDGALVAVRPAPEPGDTTRVMFTGDDLIESQTRAIFVDPATAEVRGDLPVYGTSGALPLRTWVDQLHRNLNLGEAGRLYSELAASWLGVVVLAGVGLWITRFRRARVKKDMVRPNNAVPGYRRIFSWHASTGIWLLVGALFLSATGITWSQFAGANVSALRSALNVGTPAVVTDLAPGDGASVDPHADHGAAVGASGEVDIDGFAEVLAVAQTMNVNTGLVEIRPPAADDQAWVVQEIQRSYPTEVDSVAVDGRTLDVVDSVDFADFSLVAKLARWGIDTHMGSMFGLPNQILLFVTALGIAAMVIWGYAMWWMRRPTRRPARLVGRPAPSGALSRAPWWGVAAVVLVAIGIGAFLPLMGVSLLGFVLVDAVVAAVRARPASTVD